MQKSGRKRCGPALSWVLIASLRNDDGDGETATILTWRFMENVSGQKITISFIFLWTCRQSFRNSFEKVNKIEEELWILKKCKFKWCFCRCCRLGCFSSLFANGLKKFWNLQFYDVSPFNRNKLIAFISYSQTMSSVPPKNTLMNLLFKSWIRC